MNRKIVSGRSLLAGLFIMLASGITNQASAGVALSATRVIYPSNQKQVQLGVTNNDDKSTYLIQSWVENKQGKKDSRFVITPPLFAMKGKKENTLRIIDASRQQLPQDRESLFWLNVKAIPSMDKAQKNQNALQLAIISRIKFYYRPVGLKMPPEQAASKLTFSQRGTTLTLSNPTPYYLTVTDLRVGSHSVGNTLVPPLGSAIQPLPAGAGTQVSYRTINDYGALTNTLTATLH